MIATHRVKGINRRNRNTQGQHRCLFTHTHTQKRTHREALGGEAQEGKKQREREKRGAERKEHKGRSLAQNETKTDPQIKCL